jgi:hypothetical protein
MSVAVTLAIEWHPSPQAHSSLVEMISYPEDCLACYPTLLALVIFLTLEQMVLESLYASPSKP